MVSGLVTSPWDQLRIFSGEARLIRMESKSVIVLPRSNGLERYKVFLPAALRQPLAAPVSCSFLALCSQPGRKRSGVESRPVLNLEERGNAAALLLFSQPRRLPVSCRLQF